MGPCLMQSDMIRQVKIIKTVINQMQFISPKKSTLYNILRKLSAIEIFHNYHNTSKIFIKQNYHHLQQFTPSDLKLLYNFKNFLYVGDNQEQVIQILSCTNPTTLYSITQSEANKFITQFPIFASGNKHYQPKQLPILAINSQQILNTEISQQAFIHSLKHINKELYQKLQINQIITDDGQLSIDKIAKKLSNKSGEKIILLQHESRSQNDILNILSSYAVAKFGISSLGAKMYISEYLPQSNFNQQLQTFVQKSSQQNNVALKTEKNESIPLSQLYQKRFQKLERQMGGDPQARTKVERSYNLLITLISNIYNHQGSDAYRKVKKANKQMHQLLGKYKHGVKLLDEVGFKQDEAHYSNAIDIKYLKIYRTDLDLAFKNYSKAT